MDPIRRAAQRAAVLEEEDRPTFYLNNDEVNRP